MTNPNAYFLHERAVQLDKAKQYSAAIAMCRRANSIDPEDKAIKHTLSTMYINAGYFDLAERLLDEIRVDSAAWWDARGVLSSYQGNYRDGISAFSRAAELDPAGNKKRIGLAGTYLLAGDWKAGLEAQRRYLEPTPAQPNKWEGQEVDELVIHYDLGMGDIINMARFVPWAAKKTKKCTFILPRKLAWLMQEYSQFAELSFDLNLDHQPQAIANMHSLPRLYGCSPDNIPPDPGVLSWANLPNLKTGAFNIGIVWAGNPDFPGDRWRSTSLETMLPLAADGRVCLYSLQIGLRSKDIAELSANALVTDLSGQVELDFAICAGAIQAMDLIITVDTAVAHIAGALNKPTYMLVPKFPDWRWGTSGYTTPWYPSLMLFRQSSWGDWTGPMAEILSHVRKMVNDRK